ncbi:MAG: serine--tRNA ligase [Thermoanaerobaculia bacterium]|jgi:seryl-tRNA synthetase|nr:serine--tRNA ligase [Thermoanaerobaculia bacterium]MBP9823258.1 serine--tRNA ligase [Thermoanaerobaculia bacterium]
MLSRELLRSDPERIRRAFIDRGQGPATLDEWLQIDAERRGAVTEIDELKRRRNEASREVGARKSKGEPADDLMAEVGGIKARLESLEAALAGLDEQLAALELRFPNLPDASVPVGSDETANRVERVVGTPREFDFEPKPHWDLGTDLGILDFERGAKVTGARFTVYYGAAARLERALISFMLDLHTGRHGYREVLPPFIVNRDSLVGTGNLPKFEQDLFHLEGTNYYLVPTAEVPLTNLHREEVLDESLLPLRYTAYTPCFRSEAGSYGKDVRGLIRQHQFNKVELVQLATPETSFAQLEEMAGHAERVLQLLELPYRVICLSTGDMGFASTKTYDLEVWLPSQKTYREISSCSNCGDFQARRANLRCRTEGGKPRHLHTLNGSALAVGRTLVAILENYQQADGSIAIPEKLRPYLPGLPRIVREG